MCLWSNCKEVEILNWTALSFRNKLTYCLSPTLSSSVLSPLGGRMSVHILQITLNFEWYSSNSAFFSNKIQIWFELLMLSSKGIVFYIAILHCWIISMFFQVLANIVTLRVDSGKNGYFWLNGAGRKTVKHIIWIWKDRQFWYLQISR
jgi:hypothetical protein